MANWKLIIIKKTGSDSKAVSMDIDLKLDKIREKLKNKHLMTDTDNFLFNNSPFDKGDEGNMDLKAVLGEKNELFIGQLASPKKNPISIPSTDGVKISNKPPIDPSGQREPTD